MTARRRIEVEIIGNPASLKRALGASDAALGDFGARMRSTSRSVAFAGRTLTRNLTLPIVGAGVAAGKLAYDFETSMTHVKALTGASAKQTKAWSNEILGLAGKLPQAPNELAQSLYFVASSGAKLNQVMPITIASAKAAAAGLGDTQVVAELLTSAMNAYGPAALSASQATDTLVQAIKIGKAEPADLAQNMGRAIPIAQALGVTFQETAGLIAELTNTGLDAAEATTAVRAVMVGLIKPASQTTDQLKKLGLSADGVRQAIRDKGLNAVLQDLAHRVGDNRAALGKLFPNVRALTGFLALTGKNAGNVTAALGKMNHAAGATDKAFKAAQDDGFRMRQALSDLEGQAIKTGAVLLPVAASIGEEIASLVGKFGDLSPEMQKVALIGLGVTAALGPVLAVIGSIGIVAGAAVTGLSVLGTGIVAITGLLPGFTVAMVEGEGALISFGAAGTIALGPIGLLAVGIAGVGIAAAGIIAYLSSTSGSTNELTDAANSARDAVNGLNGALDRGKAAHRAAVEARHAETAAALGVETAEKGVKTALEQSGKGSLAYRQATNQLALAKDRLSDASSRAHVAAIHDRYEMERARKAMAANKQALGGLLKAAQAHTQAVHKNTSGQVMNAVQTARVAAAEHHNQQVAHHLADDLDKLAAGFEASAGKARNATGPLATNQRHLAAVARAAAEVARAINNIPSTKQIRIQLQTDVAATTYHYANPKGYKPPTAGGGPVRMGRPYLIGERGVETFVPDTNGHVLSNADTRRAGGIGGGGGPVEMVIVNWRDGTGFIRDVADGQVSAGARRARQRERMGA